MKLNFPDRLRMAFIFWLARRLPDCKTITPMLGESLDRKFSLRDRIVMKLHLFTCDACKRYLNQIRLIRDAVKIQDIHRSTAGDLRSHLSPDAKQRIKKTIESASA